MIELKVANYKILKYEINKFNKFKLLEFKKILSSLNKIKLLEENYLFNEEDDKIIEKKKSIIKRIIDFIIKLWKKVKELINKFWTWIKFKLDLIDKITQDIKFNLYTFPDDIQIVVSNPTGKFISYTDAKILSNYLKIFSNYLLKTCSNFIKFNSNNYNSILDDLSDDGLRKYTNDPKLNLDFFKELDIEYFTKDNNLYEIIFDKPKINKFLDDMIKFKEYIIRDRRHIINLNANIEIIAKKIIASLYDKIKKFKKSNNGSYNKEVLSTSNEILKVYNTLLSINEINSHLFSLYFNVIANIANLDNIILKKISLEILGNYTENK